MFRRVASSGCGLAVALALVLASAPSQALAPVLMMMVKQIAQQVATSMIKDTLLSGLSGMGCKGIALSKALSAFDARSAAGGTGLLGGNLNLLGGMPKMPAGLMMPNLPTGMVMPSMPAGVGMLQGAGIPADMAAKMRALMPNANELPQGLTTDPEQMAMMARVQQAMSQPLSPAETRDTIDELFELGFLPKSIQSELKECMVLVPETIPALGMGMGMLKPIVPQLQQAREQLRALSPEEQDEVAATLVQEMKSLPADQRAAMLEHLDSGFFPPRISERTKTGLAAK